MSVIPAPPDPSAPPVRLGVADAAALLSSLTRNDAGRFAEFELEEIVQAHPNRIVARGRMRDREVYLKLFNVPEGPELVRAARAEYQRAARAMGNGRLRVARHIASAPRLKLIAVEGIRGTRFDFAVEQSPPETHRGLHRLAAAWLRHFSRETAESRPFDAVRFLETVRGLALEDPASGGGSLPVAVTRRWVNDGLAPDDVERRLALRAWIAAEAFAAAGRPIAIAAVHDDFSPRNLTLTPRGGLVGFDLGRLHVGPLAEAAAIFLVIQQLRQLDQPEERCMGLNPAYVEGFLEADLLPEEDARVFFPLYVAHKLDLMFSRHVARPDWLERLRPAVDAFLRAPRAMSHRAGHLALMVIPVI